MSSDTDPPRLLTIMGSGETAPTMVKVHRGMLDRLGPPPVASVLLDTPFAFQENRSELAARVQHYFAESLRARIEVASAPDEEVGAVGAEGFLNDGRGAMNVFSVEHLVSSVRQARYVFSGPGSPSYALRKWAPTIVPSLLREKLQHGGGVTFSSAAALTLGLLTIPVYEIYKVGADPYWLDGLDLVAETGIRAAVIPHYNNAEGGTHDTRYCYLGERRLSYLERELPDDAFVLGVDEHTSITFDLNQGKAVVAGLGVVTVRAAGRSRTFESGSEISVADILDAASDLRRESSTRRSMVVEREDGDGSGSASDAAAAQDLADPSEAAFTGPEGSVGGRYLDSPLIGLVRTQEAAFTASIEERDVRGAVAAVLQLEDDITEWAKDIPAGDAMDRARASLRSLVLELGRAAEEGARDPREVIGPFVEAMLQLRTEARASKRFDEADRIRDQLVGLGIEVRDGAGASEWIIA